MRNGFLGALAALLLGGGFAAAQTPYYWPAYPQYAPPAFPYSPPGYPPPPTYPPPAYAPPAGPVNASNFGVLRPPTVARSSPVSGQADNSTSKPSTSCPAPQPWTPVCEPPPPIAGVPVYQPSHCFHRGYDEGEEKSYDLIVGLEYLYWWTNAMPTPVPIVTTGSSTNAIPGALGQPNTQVLFGAGNTYFNGANGARLTVGTWFDPGHHAGIEISGFCFEKVTSSITPSNSVIAVPIALPGAGESAVPIASPVTQSNPLNLASTNPNAIVTSGPYAGTLTVSESTQLWGLELNGVSNLYRSRSFVFDLLGGFRYLNLHESLGLNASSTDLVLDVTDTYSDLFQTSNQFAGGQLGVRANCRCGPFFLGAAVKAAFGANFESMSVNGSTVQTSAGSSSTFAGGILTQRSNIGTHNETTFSFVPQAQLKVGVEFIPNVRVFLGYDLLCWTNVVRAGDQVDHTVNGTQSFGGTLVGPANPASMFNQSNYFIQGLTVGMEMRF